ncbi:hypothetical protein ACTQWG_09600 [Blautia sp. HCP3S3_H10_1]|uniref:hypothetical protein n=1 Tax=unclassified Blautia TaxID=2648079 RepID=UPI003F93A81E|nr:hypothetical protein [Clostridia bacterium]
MRKTLQKIEVNSFIDEFVKARQKYFTKGQEWLEADLAEEKIYVYADKNQLAVELDELVKNSLMHSAVVPMEMRIQVERASDGAKINYMDNGAGTWRNRSFFVAGNADARAAGEKRWGVQMA